MSMFTVYLHTYFHSDFVQELVISQTVGGVIQVKLTSWNFYIVFPKKKKPELNVCRCTQTGRVTSTARESSS